jgi:hypothetical protein
MTTCLTVLQSPSPRDPRTLFVLVSAIVVLAACVVCMTQRSGASELNLTSSHGIRCARLQLSVAATLPARMSTTKCRRRSMLRSTAVMSATSLMRTTCAAPVTPTIPERLASNGADSGRSLPAGGRGVAFSQDALPATGVQAHTHGRSKRFSIISS